MWQHAQKRLNVEVVGGEDDLEQHLLIDGDKLLVPLRDVSRPLAGLILVRVCIGGGQRLPTMMFAVLQDLVDTTPRVSTLDCIWDEKMGGNCGGLGVE